MNATKFCFDATVLLSPSNCNIPERRSSAMSTIPSAFIVMLLGNSIALRRQQKQQYKEPDAKHMSSTLHRDIISDQQTFSSSPTALGFGRRTESDIDYHRKKRVDRLLLDYADSENEVFVAHQIMLESANVSDTINQSNTQSSAAAIKLFNPSNDTMDTLDISSDNANKNSRRFRFSSIPGLLPGRPLLLRPYDLFISKMMEEERGLHDDMNVTEQERIYQEYIDIKESRKKDKQQQQKISNAYSKAAAATNKDGKRKRTRRFFRRSSKKIKSQSSKKKPSKGSIMTKAEFECPIVVRNIYELQSSVLEHQVPLRDVGFRFPAKGLGSQIAVTTDNLETSEGVSGTIFQRDDPIINGPLSSLLTCNAANSSDYQRGIELLSHHPVLSIVRERVKAKSKPGDRQGEGIDAPHLALVIEGGGMRGAVSAGMAAALSTLDLLDAFDSVHGSSAGAIVGAYLVSRQLCTDVYTDIMPAAGSKFASKRRGMVNFGWDYLESKLIAYEEEDKSNSDDADDDGFCIVDDLFDEDENSTESWLCEDDISSVELAMGRITEKRGRGRWSDDHGVLHESMIFLLSNTIRGAKSSVAKPFSAGVQRLGQAFDFATSMRQYLRKRPGMNLTYVLDGVMDETHGLRPFDLSAFRANDKKQPLYIVASTASNGGKGEMETVAFNSKEGDFFGSAHDDEDESTPNDEQISWSRRIWNLFSFVPYKLFSVARKALLTGTASEFSPPMKDTIENEALPPGSSAMHGFANRQKIRKMKRPIEDDKSYGPTGHISDEGKQGLFPCLEASMLVPAAAGPPIQLIRSKNRHLVEQRSRFPRFRPKAELNKRKEINSHLCCDAFCYEPIPYRSAVEKADATHVLALRSRPDGCIVESKQHMYEKVVAPIYFRKHGMNQVAKLFSTGGSQYRYLEDVMVLNEGLTQGIAVGQNKSSSKGVAIPPTKLFVGTDDADSFSGTDDWKRAHLLPITLPLGTPELPSLSQDKDEVLKAVRAGYAAAFDVLAPIAGLSFDSKTIPGERVAKILFPDGDDDVDKAILTTPKQIKASIIGEDEEESKRQSFASWIRRKRYARRKAKDEIVSHPNGLLARRAQRRNNEFVETDQYVRDDSDTLEYIEIEALLAALPGFRGGRLDHIADSLRAKQGEVV